MDAIIGIHMGERVPEVYETQFLIQRSLLSGCIDDIHTHISKELNVIELVQIIRRCSE